ncbi:MAG: MBL fold metallo-hydrolase [Segniliparus sp.]|uniref:MBL fold metallo-hydrolase n=1 Tax=Segniliparus sp. TaxID=2804064 RepID=UPI003F2C27DC
MVSQLSITHIGGPTTLIEVGGWRLVTDPTFDPGGNRFYSMGPGIGSRKTTAPSVPLGELGPVDAVLLSHHGHDDNLDEAGRTLLPKAGAVVTTPEGAKSLGRKKLCGNAIGLRRWETTTLEAEGKPTITVTATPGRHGPPLSKPVVGPVTGFALSWPGQRDGALWISGDTVWFNGLAEVAERLDIAVAVVHLGAAKFRLTGPMRYTMTADEAALFAQRSQAKTIVPVHYEGWSHFSEGRDRAEAAFRAKGVSERVRWIGVGNTAAFEV